MTRNEIQSKALESLVKNNYTGTICLSTGTGKSKVAIDAIKQGNFQIVLITSPRTNLKENWQKEIEKWFLPYEREKRNERKGVLFIFENIQTCYKWSREKLMEFDLIIADEIHTMATPEYGKLIVDACKCNIPVIGLTATPDKDGDYNGISKEEFYLMYCPIIFEYYDSAEDGLINKREYIVYNHYLSNDDKIIVGTKHKKWQAGEKDQYDFYTEQIRRGQRLMAATGSTDWFKDAGEWFWKGNGTPEQKTAARVYLQGIKNRKDLLWNLSSTRRIAREIANEILKKENSKVLIFSELNSQVRGITPHCVYSKNSEEENKTNIALFDKGDIRELGSCHSLTLGLNLKLATHAIMESYSGSDVAFKQKAGRLDRLEVEDIAIVIFIVVKNTQAEEWFKNATNDLDYTPLICSSIEELKSYL